VAATIEIVRKNRAGRAAFLSEQGEERIARKTP
jgi:hypothetical protein